VTRDDLATLRASTPARVGLARAGTALTTADQLALRLAHAGASDAVHAPLDVARLEADLAAVGEDRAIVVRSAAGDRPTYVRRPDLGRRLADGADAERALRSAGPHDLAIVLADGLSPAAVNAHGPSLVGALRAALGGWSVPAPVIALQARVAIGDPIGALLHARVVLVLIGERPGLSAHDSLGAYLTAEPRPGRTDAERVCVSNIRSPGGLDVGGAARQIAHLAREAHRRRRTGVAARAVGRSLPVPATQGPSDAPAS